MSLPNQIYVWFFTNSISVVGVSETDELPFTEISTKSGQFRYFKQSKVLKHYENKRWVDVNEDKVGDQLDLFGGAAK